MKAFLDNLKKEKNFRTYNDVLIELRNHYEGTKFSSQTVHQQTLDMDLIRSVIVEEVPKLIKLPESVDFDKFKTYFKKWLQEEEPKLINLPKVEPADSDEIRRLQLEIGDLIDDLDKRLSALEAAIPRERVEQAIRKKEEEENRKLQEMQRYGKNLTPDFKTADKSITQ